MLNKKGMVLMEALFLMMLCMIFISILIYCTQALYQVNRIDEGGYNDEELKKIYEQ